MRTSTQWIALSAAAVLGIAAVGIWRYGDWRSDDSETQIHNTAVADAAEKVDKVLSHFRYDNVYRADEYAHTAGQHSDVRVLSVTGQTHWQTGVTLVLKVTGHGVAIGADRSVIRERNTPICFRLRLGPHDDSRDDDIDCPAGTPLPITQDPSLDGIDERLQRALDAVGPNEAAVRAAVAGLNLDRAIQQDIVARDGMVGVALRATQYDCVIARVAAEGARLWRPSHVQLAPGELGCSAGIALSSQFGRHPH